MGVAMPSVAFGAQPAQTVPKDSFVTATRPFNGLRSVPSWRLMLLDSYCQFGNSNGVTRFRLAVEADQHPPEINELGEHASRHRVECTCLWGVMLERLRTRSLETSEVCVTLLLRAQQNLTLARPSSMQYDDMRQHGNTRQKHVS
eukprot:3929291-Amphidinium_carterae.1